MKAANWQDNIEHAKEDSKTTAGGGFSSDGSKERSPIVP